MGFNGMIRWVAVWARSTGDREGAATAYCDRRHVGWRLHDAGQEDTCPARQHDQKRPHRAPRRAAPPGEGRRGFEAFLPIRKQRRKYPWRKPVSSCGRKKEAAFVTKNRQVRVLADSEVAGISPDAPLCPRRRTWMLKRTSRFGTSWAFSQHPAAEGPRRLRQADDHPCGFRLTPSKHLQEPQVWIAGRKGSYRQESGRR
jgi:hypothetical protein